MPSTSHNTHVSGQYHRAPEAQEKPNGVVSDCTSSFPIVPVAEPLSRADKLMLYLSLQDIAEELRRIHHERKKNQQSRENQQSI